MKFQKTFLAASLAIAAVSANAAWVNPAQNLTSLTSADAAAPVIGVEHLSTITTTDTSIDLGSGAVDAGLGLAGVEKKFEIFNYKTFSNADVISLKDLATGEIVGTYYRPTTSSNATLVEYQGSDIDYATLSKGGQLKTTDSDETTEGEELKVINSEHVIYGYQGTTIRDGAELTGDLITPDGVQAPFTGTLPNRPNSENIKYVQNGIIGNTGPKDAEGHALDVSKNIYGVSAKDGNNITVLTGNGIALGDLSNGGQLFEDGSVVTANGVLIGNPTAQKTLKSREYNIDGKTYVKTYNDDPGQDVAPTYYEVVGQQLVTVDGTALEPKFAALTPDRTGTAISTTGNYLTSLTKNTVTNKNVTYSEEAKISTLTQTSAGITNSTADGDTVVTNVTNPVELSSVKQSVATGVIGENAEGNIYGLTVSKERKEGGAVVSSDATTITADGITTTGTITAGDVIVGGVSFSDAVGGLKEVNAQVDQTLEDFRGTITETVAEVKGEIQKELVEFKGTATALTGRVDQLNNRINSVKETAYSGVAIALAAQQQVPNIGAGQLAVFGGVGHYEGESAGALGLVGVLADGRTSLSAALGVAGSGDVGGRAGVSYVFGAK